MNKVQINAHSLLKHVFVKDFNSFLKKDFYLNPFENERVWIKKIPKDLDLDLNPFTRI